MFWGFSEFLDLHEEYIQHINSDKKELNILLYGAGDPRHILQTIGKSYKHGLTKINFYILDGSIELVARNLLLLSVALESELSFTTKTHMYMDLYGNSLLRPNSYCYMSSKAEVLTKIISDSDFLEEISPFLVIDYLKYRERDDLLETFNFWHPKPGNLFHIESYWECRVRELLGVRYDYRDGVFDWDLHMRLKDNAKQICPQEYKHWRNTGIAFTFPEYEQSKPNKTLCCGLARNGLHYKNRGYVGDIVVGPFCTFGLTCSDTKMLQSNHGANEFRATDITERNINELFYEIENRKTYISDGKNVHKYGNVQIRLEKSIDAGHHDITNGKIELEKYDQPYIKIANFKIIYLSIDDILNLQNCEKFQGFFDIVFISNTYFNFLKCDFSKIFNKQEQSLILFETKLYYPIKKEEANSFVEKIKNFAKSISLENITNFNINIAQSIIKYKTK